MAGAFSPFGVSPAALPQAINPDIRGKRSPFLDSLFD